jgi:hypothetical protein
MSSTEKKLLTGNDLSGWQTRRVNRIMDALEKLGDCSNLRNYYYSNTDTKMIFEKIEKKLKETRLKFQGTSKIKKEGI